jgi:SAM-dependent methyltransferase
MAAAVYSGLLPVASPFDAIAGTYDEVFTESPVGKAQRAAVWKELEKAFHSGDHVLDIGCGTGVDACFLAERGVSVFAFDSSPGMIEMAERRVRKRSSYFLNASVDLCTWTAERIAGLQPSRQFEGAFSNFGILNCIQDWKSFARALASRLRTGSKALFCLMGPCCLWEVAWFLAHGKPRRAVRRFRRAGTMAKFARGAEFQVCYPTVHFLKKTFAPEFRLRGIKGIGLCVPPSYVSLISNNPRMMELAMSADRLLARCPGFRVLADHILVTFERTRS